jgi:hypothetical protein
MRHPGGVAATPGIVLLALWIALSAWKALSIRRQRSARQS